TGFPFNVRWPRVIGVKLTGTLSGWSSPKDVILEVARILTVEGGTGAIVEYYGSGADSISATGKATICNMGAEIGATCSVFGYDDNLAQYLKATGREAIADAANKVAEHLRPDDGAVYDQIIEIDLDALKPLINGPHSPDRANRIGAAVGAEARANDWPLDISAALIGSCTNSSYEDITRAASIARQASARGLMVKTPLLVSPGSEQIRATIERDGLIADLEAIGATVLANACGPCIGQWDRPVEANNKPNTIVNSFNRNFPKRNDGSALTLSFVTSPDTVVALALSGQLDFDPSVDTLTAPDGSEVTLSAPVGEVLPSKGYDPGKDTFTAPPADGSDVSVQV
ncbi:MAG: aconitate hydratase, partial [Ilumatobacteraceae bacterium]|nr:aconitate hydratase [Ilumatobacteraceae bacterium]